MCGCSYAWLVTRRLLLHVGHIYNLRVEIFSSMTLVLLMLLLAGLILQAIFTPLKSLRTVVDTAAGLTIILNCSVLVFHLVRLVSVGASINLRFVDHQEKYWRCSFAIASCILALHAKKTKLTMLAVVAILQHQRTPWIRCFAVH